MRVAKCHLSSTSPYGQSKAYFDPPREEKEQPDDYEKRTWRERAHWDGEGNMFIPPMSFKNSLATAAAFLSIHIKGRGQATYTKHFVAGVLVHDKIVLPYTRDNVPGQWLFVPSDGKKGGARRVWKCFPVIPSWKGEVTFYVTDETITPDIFERVLREAGNFIGLGFFRMERGGFYGGFKVDKIVWSEE